MTKNAKRVSVICACLLVVLCAFLAAKAQRTEEQQLAEEILDVTGIKGGLIVHIGCGNGRLTAALRASDSYIVHGLDADMASVEEAREYIKSLKLYGEVSTEQLKGSRLPYIDNLVNLVVSEDPDQVSMDEVMRVLCPNGVAYIKKDGEWVKSVKPRPEEIDEWTHYLHDASGNPVAHDSLVGPPRRLQWVGSPKWARHHDHMASMSALVSSNDRIFYIFDEGPTSSIQLPPKWFLAARDAFNGTVLWKRPISRWNTHLWPLKSGPAQITRRLVAVGDTVYVTLGIDEPLTALDAATGETIRTYDGTRSTEEIINTDGVLFLLVNELPNEWVKFRPKHTYVWDNTGRANRGWAWDEKKRRIMAVEASTGKVLWEKEYLVAPLTLAADGESVYFHDGEKAVCLDRKNGEENWTSEPIKRRSPMPVSFGPRLVVHEDVVVFAGGDRSMTALSAQTGKTLWTGKHARSGHQSPEDLIVVDGLVWSASIAGGNDPGIFTGLDLYTGEVKSEFPPDVETYWFHHRCYPSKATDRYLLPSRTGIEFVDYRNKHWTTHHWVRGGCIYGIMPCNGLVYAPPHSCACYIEAKLNGFCALAPESVPRQVSDNDRLERGPAYEQMGNPESEIENPNDWPTYRHDPARSGFTKQTIPAELERSWRTDLGGRLSSVVIAGDKAFVASIDTHTVYALDASTGEILWSYTAGGRVDSPPTIYQGRVLFGSVDGWVYCLRASDGALIWRFRAAPVDERLMAFEQLESVWPVHGNVLVQDDTVRFVAGRSMFLDGGLRLFQLDPKTGHKISETILDDRDPETGDNLQVRVKGLNMPVALPDVLSCDGNYVYMRSQRFDLQDKRQEIGPINVTEQVGEGTHLFSPVGFVDDTWFHRSYWMFGRNVASGWGGWFRAGRFVPSGRILVFDESSVYGYGRRPEYLSQSSVLEYQLFSASKQVKAESIQRVQAGNRRMNATSSKNNVHAADWKARKDFPLADRTATDFRWWRGSPPLQVRAMVLADKTLFMAGPPDVANEEQAFYAPDDEEVLAKLNEQSEALEGKKGALLWVVSTADGEKLAERKLDSPPVFDGMAASNGRLYLATMDGKVLCFSGK